VRKDLMLPSSSTHISVSVIRLGSGNFLLPSGKFAPLTSRRDWLSVSSIV